VRALIAAAVCAALPGWLMAQTVGAPPNPNFPAPSTPGYRAPTVPVTPEYTLPSAPQAAPDASGSVATGGQLFVRHIEVRGVKVLNAALVQATVAPYENRMVSATELQGLRIALTQLYVNKGYINSGVLLPDQQIKDGLVVLQAIEGKLTRVRKVGKSKLSQHYVASRIMAHVDDPLNVTQLQTSLRYLQEDPNVARLDARLGPGDAPGQSVLQVQVDDQPRFYAGIGGDNYQSPSIGAEEGNLTFGARNLTGYGDDFKGTASHSGGNTVGSAVFSIPVTAHNAALQAYYSTGDAAIIQQPFKQLNVKETVRTYGLSLTLPLLDRLDNRLSVILGAESDRSDTKLLGTGFSFSPGAQNGVSDVTQVYGGLDWLLHAGSSVTDVRLTYRRGIDALGATENEPANVNLPSNPNPTGEFGLEQLQFIHIQRLNGFSLFNTLNDRAQLIVRASGQYTQDPLLSVVKFPVGGVDTVRGFPANSFVRDDGAVATLELQMPVPGYRADAGLMNLVIAPFIDYGRSWDKDNADPGNPLDDTSVARYMASAGIGVLWNPFRGANLQVYWGRGIANNFRAFDPRLYIPHDLQYDGVYFAVNYVYKW
jgi:hemolysin activation/secretion protein